jgi:hypothetical protein
LPVSNGAKNDAPVQSFRERYGVFITADDFQ